MNIVYHIFIVPRISFIPSFRITLLTFRHAERDHPSGLSWTVQPRPGTATDLGELFPLQITHLIDELCAFLMVCMQTLMYVSVSTFSIQDGCKICQAKHRKSSEYYITLPVNLYGKNEFLK